MIFRSSPLAGQIAPSYVSSNGLTDLSNQTSIRYSHQMHHIPHEICSVSAAKRARIEPTWASWNPSKKTEQFNFLPLSSVFFLTNTLFAIYHHFGWCNLFLKIFNIYIVLSDELMPKLYLYILELLLYHFFCWHLMSATNTRNTHIHATKKYFFLVINTIFVAKLCISFLTPYLTQIRVRPLSDTNAVIGHNN